MIELTVVSGCLLLLNWLEVTFGLRHRVPFVLRKARLFVVVQLKRKLVALLQQELALKKRATLSARFRRREIAEALLANLIAAILVCLLGLYHDARLLCCIVPETLNQVSAGAKNVAYTAGLGSNFMADSSLHESTLEFIDPWFRLLVKNGDFAAADFEGIRGIVNDPELPF